MKKKINYNVNVNLNVGVSVSKVLHKSQAAGSTKDDEHQRKSVIAIPTSRHHSANLICPRERPFVIQGLVK